ncbi:MAG: DM13 domain-containing protein [Acidimicrobiia bacterium]|nr:DM13 domain-containing protein [Acidimicrobiia bacterium]
MLLGSVAVAVFVFGVVWFQPQALFFDTVVDDTLPGTPASTNLDPGTATQSDTTDARTDASTTTTRPVSSDETDTARYPVTLAVGEFIDLAHQGSGTASIVELEDGTRILRFDDLDVDNGPDLRVILSSSELVDDDAAYDDGDFVDLGDLKGNKGNQNYEIPPQIDLGAYPTVAIWCRRFNVTFNAAPLGG